MFLSSKKQSINSHLINILIHLYRQSSNVYSCITLQIVSVELGQIWILNNDLLTTFVDTG